jgi:hypothetical protein
VLKSRNLSLGRKSGSLDFAERQEVDSCTAVTVKVQCRIRHMSHRGTVVTSAGYSRLSWLSQRGNCVCPSDTRDFILSVFNTEICSAEDTNLSLALV